MIKISSVFREISKSVNCHFDPINSFFTMKSLTKLLTKLALAEI